MFLKQPEVLELKKMFPYEDETKFWKKWVEGYRDGGW
jgi:hypothetical protein